MSYRRLLALLVYLAGGASGILAGPRGGFFGRILDTSDGAVAEAAITITSEETGFRRITSSDPTGNFTVPSLAPGVYKITIRKEGFQTAMKFGVRLADALVRADFVLPVGSIEETITVEDSEPLATRTDPSTGGRIERDEIDRLPLNGGGILDLLELTGGTNVVPATRGEAGQFTTTGQRPNTNYFTVDGMSANIGVTAGGLPAASPGGVLPAVSAFGSLDSLITLDSVEQFRVRTSTAVAEFGRMPGAAVSITTRSGGNQFHGTTSYRLRNELADANDWFGNAAGYGPLPLRLQDVSQTFGGPLRRNRTFFFLSYEHMALLQPLVWNQPVPSPAGRQKVGDWVQPVLNLFPVPANPTTTANVGEWTGRTDRPARLDAGGVRVDQAIGSRVSLFGRYNDSPSDNAFGTLAVDQLHLRAQSFTLGVNARLSSRLVLDFRANESESRADSFWTGDTPGTAGCELDPLAVDFLATTAPCSALVRFSIGGIGQLVSGPEGSRWQRQFQVTHSTGLRLGKHALEVGADYRHIVLVRRDPTGTLGVIADTLSQLTNPNNLWIARSSAQNGTAPVQELSLWIEDTWQATSRLTVAGGLRWEFNPATQSAAGNPQTGTLFFNPATQTFFPTTKSQALWPTSYHDFAPRLGLAWQLTGDGRTMLRAGGGIYYDSSLSIAADILNGGPLGISSYTSPRAGLFSSQLSYGFMPNLTVPEVKEWNLSVERALGRHDVLSAGYIGSLATGLIRRELGGPGNTPTSLVAVTTNNARSDYHALEVQYRRRVARGVQAIAAYDWAHSIDNDSSDSFLVWVGSPASNRGSSDFDLRHSLTGSVTYELPAEGGKWLRGWALDGVLRARSGFPITVLQNEQYMGITLINAFRPNLALGQPLWLSDGATPGGKVLNAAAFLPTPTATQGILGRNAITGFGMWQLDLALRRDFKLTERMRVQARLEAFNALNHPNFADPVAYLDSPVFGQSTSMLNMMLGTGSPGSGLSPILQTGGPRSLQLAVKWVF